jgi:5-methylcytosine-specific restriction endonuclease McrA
MTIDHILPRSKGGKDTLENLQPMCSSCNAKKADKV